MTLLFPRKCPEGDDSWKVYGEMLQAIKREIVKTVPFISLCDATKSITKNIGLLDDLSSFSHFVCLRSTLKDIIYFYVECASNVGGKSTSIY